MFVRARWFVFGATAGTVMALRTLNAAKQMLPQRLAPKDLAGAWKEGRSAMYEREAELRQWLHASAPLHSLDKRAPATTRARSKPLRAASRVSGELSHLHSVSSSGEQHFERGSASKP